LEARLLDSWNYLQRLPAKMRLCKDEAGGRAVSHSVTNPLPQRVTSPSTEPRSGNSKYNFRGLARVVALPGRRSQFERSRHSLVAQVAVRQLIPSSEFVPPENTVPEPDPLFLFWCQCMWQKQGDQAAGWELIQALRSSQQPARVAAVLLSETEDLDLRTKIPADAENRTNTASFHFTSQDETGTNMNTPYGLEIIESCTTCRLRRPKWFCCLAPDVLKTFSADSHLGTYPGGAILFVEGQMPRGAFVLCSGKVKLSTTSREGKVLILKIAEPGEALGLSALISGTPYEVTAETAGPCQVNFLRRDALMKLLEQHGELGLHAAQALSKEFQSAYRDIHELVLARSSAGKLARLLLSWASGREEAEDAREIRVRSVLTHEEMAQMIGSSRETVTRLLSELKKKELIRLEGSILVIRNRTALEALAA
jgi:CRP/FNR family cyclic AMP-dependent transcriptional regulator